jgi:predicted Fe-Mo cluster-binding NifX family protein
MLKVAIPVSAGSVASTFDFARRVVIVECEAGHEICRTETTLTDSRAGSRVKQLARLGAQVLICGAISQSSAALVNASGINLLPLVSGPVEEVLAAFLSGQLDDRRFLLPGCTPEDREPLTSPLHAAGSDRP